MNRRTFLAMAVMAPLVPAVSISAARQVEIKNIERMLSRLTAKFDKLSIEGKKKMIAAFDYVPSQLDEDALPENKQFSRELKAFYQRRLDAEVH